MWKKFLIMLAIFGLVVGVLAYIKVKQIQTAMAMGALMAPPPPAVATAESSLESWPRQLRAVGTLNSVQGVLLTAQLEGAVEKIHFSSGQTVQAGDLLLEQDISEDHAELESALARKELADISLNRSRELLQKEAVAQSEVDNAKAEFRRASADADAIQARIDRKQIRAPFAGRLGIREVDIGEYLRGGDPVVVLEAMDPIFVNFTLPQQNLPSIKVGQQVEVIVDAYGSQRFHGELTAIEPRINSGTRSIRLQATLDNKDGKLLSGMFAQVYLGLDEIPEYVTVPVSAVTYTPYGDSVYIIEEVETEDAGKTTGVRQQFINVGPQRGNQVAILSGLDANVEIVTAGQMKLQNGIPVTINNEIQPSSDPNPQPEER